MKFVTTLATVVGDSVTPLGDNPVVLGSSSVAELSLGMAALNTQLAALGAQCDVGHGNAAINIGVVRVEDSVVPGDALVQSFDVWRKLV